MVCRFQISGENLSNDAVIIGMIMLSAVVGSIVLTQIDKLR